MKGVEKMLENQTVVRALDREMDMREFYPNVWHSYSRCKQIVVDAQSRGELSWEDYDPYVDYVIEKLGI